MFNLTAAAGVNWVFSGMGLEHMQQPPLTSAWKQAVSQIGEEEIGPGHAAMLGMAVPLGDIDGTILVAVPNDFTRSFLETRLAPQLTDALREILGRDLRLAFSIDASLGADQDSDGSSTGLPETGRDSGQADSTPYRGNESVPLPTPTSQMAIDSITSTRLNPRYVFETFVIGPSNRFAQAAASAVSESPATSYNPLFIYGGSGLGKTHLLHAIGHYALSMFPHLRVRYVSSEEFTNDFINAIQAGRNEEFKRRYREVDILLIDDIQFLQHKEGTMEEFFHTFNALHNANKQVVITSDLPPKMLSDFEDRLRSRFEWGLITDVRPPDLETRIAILRKKAAVEGLVVTPEVLEYIAERVSSNIRELEGALLRVTAYANLTQEPITLGLATTVLKDIISDANDQQITSSLIMGQTASYFDVTIEQLSSAERTQKTVNARQIAMYLCRELTDLSLPKIGEAFGGRDHTTVIHANKKISGQMAERREVYNHVTELTSRIKHKAREG